MLEILQGTPLWVFGVFLLICYYGFKALRPFRTVKEAHETLYHFHKPETEVQANEWLMRYLVRTYNVQSHRSEQAERLWALSAQLTGIDAFERK